MSAAPEYLIVSGFMDWILSHVDYGCASFVPSPEGALLVSHFSKPDRRLDELWAQYRQELDARKE